MHTSNFISCDWGTSSFRLRLVETKTKIVLAETLSAQGIAITFDLWKQQDKLSRLTFYSSFILQQLSLLENEYGKLSNDFPIIISGMAASAIGMYELPYKTLPIHSLSSELTTQTFNATESFPYKTILVSGLCTSDDVMRGEETILCGCIIKLSKEKQLFIFPGTHSKHVVIENGMIKDFKTYMTGEVFDLLCNKSLLASSVEKVETGNDQTDLFYKGVRDARQGNLLNNIFRVRVNTLLNGLSKTENYIYLSGLIIGEEIKSIDKESYDSINLVSSGSLMNLYASAFATLGLEDKISISNADNALVEGQALILEHAH